MLLLLKKSIVLLFLSCLTFSCPTGQKEVEQNRESANPASYDNTTSELTQEQQSAFDALTTLQTRTDDMNRLYSTFPNIDQPCYPADTSFEITQSELLIFMEQFIVKHCKNLRPEIQNQLAKTAVLAQEKYIVLHCTNDVSNINYKEGLPMTGTWVMPNVLGQRDVILMW